MATIYTAHGLPILCDDDYYEWLNSYTWSLSSGYASTILTWPGGARRVVMHRFIMDPPAHLYVDHANHCRADNRRHNLRFATHKENQQNQIGKSHVRYDRLSQDWLYTRGGVVVKRFDNEKDARSAKWDGRLGVSVADVIRYEQHKNALLTTKHT